MYAQCEAALHTYIAVRNGNQCIWHQKLHDFRSDYYGSLSCGLLNAKEMETESDYIASWIIHWGFSLLAAVPILVLVATGLSIYINFSFFSIHITGR